MRSRIHTHPVWPAAGAQLCLRLGKVVLVHVVVHAVDLVVEGTWRFFSGRRGVHGDAGWAELGALYSRRGSRVAWPGAPGAGAAREIRAVGPDRASWPSILTENPY